MPKKSQKRAPKRARAARRLSKSKGSARAAAATSGAPSTGRDKAAAAQRFVNDLLIRGEAEKLDEKGILPQHATHVIKKQNPDGSADVERVRFKMF